MLSNSASNLKLISVVLSSKSADFSKVISVIDEMVTWVKAEQGEDDGKKACCTESFGQTEFESPMSKSRKPSPKSVCASGGIKDSRGPHQ